MFIVLEGIDGSGKSTQVRLLADYISKKYNKTVITTREPGGLDLEYCETLRKLALNYDIDDHSRALLMAASRIYHQNEIRKLIAQDIIVISDRYLASSFAYQQDIDIDLICEINKIDEIVHPDLILHIDISKETYLSRKATRTQERDLDAIESKCNEYFLNCINRYSEAYFNMLQDYSKIVKINGDKDVNSVFEAIINKIDKLFK